MGYRKIPGSHFTGQDVERGDRENLVSITLGERAKAESEQIQRPPMLPRQCGATWHNDKDCIFEDGHKGRHSWEL